MQKVSLVSKVVKTVGYQAAKNAVCSASWMFMYQQKEPKCVRDKFVK